jgi:hypothetical protein
MISDTKLKLSDYPLNAVKGAYRRNIIIMIPQAHPILRKKGGHDNGRRDTRSEQKYSTKGGLVFRARTVFDYCAVLI